MSFKAALQWLQIIENFCELKKAFCDLYKGLEERSLCTGLESSIKKIRGTFKSLSTFLSSELQKVARLKKLQESQKLDDIEKALEQNKETLIKFKAIMETGQFYSSETHELILFFAEGFKNDIESVINSARA